MVLKFCANLSFMFHEGATILERYKLAKDAGFAAVEFASPYEYSIQQVVETKEKTELEQILINVPIGDVAEGELGFAALPDKSDKFMESFSRSIEYAKALKCGIIHIMSGKVTKKTGLHYDTFEKNIRSIVPTLEKEGIIGVIEPINGITIPNYFLDNYPDAVDVIKKINSPNLKLQLDIFHLQHITGNLTHNIKMLLPYVGHIQIAQVPYRNEPHTKGEIDYCYILNLLDKQGYSGWIGLEYRPSTSSTDSIKWIENYGYTL